MSPCAASGVAGALSRAVDAVREVKSPVGLVTAVINGVRVVGAQGRSAVALVMEQAGFDMYRSLKKMAA